MAGFTCGMPAIRQHPAISAVGWGRPKFITFFLQRNTKESCGKGLAATPKKPKQRGLYREALTPTPLEHKHWFFKSQLSGEGKPLGAAVSGEPFLPLLAHLWDQFGVSNPWPASGPRRKHNFAIFSSALLFTAPAPPPFPLAYQWLP